MHLYTYEVTKITAIAEKIRFHYACCKALHVGLSISKLMKKSRIKRGGKCIAKQHLSFIIKKYTALVETLLVKIE